MSFLNPTLVWGLFAVAGPLLIHWIHQSRHRTMPWAATLFLQKARAANARWSKLRQWLLLAARTLAVAALALAFSRPITGGWLPGWLGEKPECVLLLLDRSSSMEAPVEATARSGPAPASKRAHALRLWEKAAANTPANRWIFFENVLRTPLELSGLAGLQSLPVAGPTDTGADIPALILAALAHLEAQHIGRAEIWIASDMQSSNWRADSPDWELIREKAAGWKGATLLRLLDLSTVRAGNTALTLRELRTRIQPATESAHGLLRLALKVQMSLQPPESFQPGTARLLLSLRGASSEQEIPLQAPTQVHRLVPPSLPAEGGWGSLQLPADGHNPDNAVYFAWGPPEALHAAVVGAGASAKLLQLACAPDPASGFAAAALLPPETLSEATLANTDLLVWNAGPLPAQAAKRLQPWIESGGVLLQFPPDAFATEAAKNPELQPGGLPESGVFSPPSWDAAESSAEPFTPALWDETEGPLSKTENGQSLPLSSVEIRRRQIPLPGRTGQVVATYGDGRAFLTRQSVGRGLAYAVSTGVEESWSSLGDGLVLVPVLHRLLVQAAALRRPATQGTAGEWRPEPEEIWVPTHRAADEPASGDASSFQRVADPRWNAGVYRQGARWLALNRPEVEDDARTLPASDLAGLLPGVPLKTLENASALSTEAVQNELWPAISVLLALFLCAEMALCWMDPSTPSKARPPIKSPVA